MLISEAVTLENELDIVQRKIANLNLFIADPDTPEVARAGALDLLWRAIDKEADLHNRLYNQTESLSAPDPEPVLEQVTLEPETELEPIAIEEAQKENDQNQKNDQSSPEPVPAYIIEKVQTDVTLYTEQLEKFDRAIESQAFADLPEDEQASKLRARDHLAGYLEEAKEELESFGPLFDGIDELEPVAELEQELERMNEPDLASDFDVLFGADPEQVIENEAAKPSLMQLAQLKFACPFCKANADVVDADEDLIDVVCSREKKHYALIKKQGVHWQDKKALGGNSSRLDMFVYGLYDKNPKAFNNVHYTDAMKTALDLRLETLSDEDYHFLSKEELICEAQLAKKIFNRFPVPHYRPWVLASAVQNPDRNNHLLEAELEILPQINDLVKLPEPEITPPVSIADELADLQEKVSQAKALAEKNRQLQAEKAVIESELAELELQLERIFAGGYNEFADIEAAKIQREIEVRQRCRREIMAHFESPDSIVPAWAKWQDRIDELTPSPEPEVLEPEPVKPAKPKPAVKPVKVDQIGSVTPTLGQLSEAVLEILSRDPHFASREMLDLALPGSPWLFDVNKPNTREMLTGFLSGVTDSGVIEVFSTKNGQFYRLKTLSTPSEPEPVNNEPRCEYCNGHMQPINGNQGQWRCLGDLFHSFYISCGQGVWVDQNGDFPKKITTVLPSWAKKEG